MKTIKCDRCGKEVTNLPLFINMARNNGYLSPLIRVTVWSSFAQTFNDVDLCEDCKNGVYRYIFVDKKQTNNDI